MLKIMKLNSLKLIEQLDLIDKNLKKEDIDSVRNCIQLATEDFIANINKIDKDYANLITRGNWYRGYLIKYIKQCPNKKQMKASMQAIKL